MGGRNLTGFKVEFDKCTRFLGSDFQGWQLGEWELDVDMDRNMKWIFLYFYFDT